ncbi:polysaccharide deacetylase family protein [Breoghania sp. JC706]|uniref:polysaccharide deacetylase family protein n=1 Tax=Breoghania sp. JC706 TaxID=3117732 RepID=UPI00300BB6E5
MTNFWKTLGYRTAMDVLYFSGVHRMLAPLTRGCGLLYMLHRVTPARDEAFQPNAFLEVTPEFLEEVIVDTRAAGVEFVSITEAHRRLVEGDFAGRFAVMTLDDGYQDNLDVALPVFRRHRVPFTVFASSGIADGSCELWWLALERIIAENSAVRIDFEDQRKTVQAGTTAEKDAAYVQLCHWIGYELDEHAQRRAIRALARDAGLDLRALCRSLAMDWDGLRRLKAEPLATVGAHTVGHHAVARMSEAEARAQMAEDVARHEAELGERPQFFAYPYGGKQAAGARDFAIAADLGFKLAVTTRPGQIFPCHREHLTALPRVSLNGLYQKRRYVELLRGGAPFALYNGFRRLDVA